MLACCWPIGATIGHMIKLCNLVVYNFNTVGKVLFLSRSLRSECNPIPLKRNGITFLMEIEKRVIVDVLLAHWPVKTYLSSDKFRNLDVIKM